MEEKRAYPVVGILTAVTILLCLIVVLSSDSAAGKWGAIANILVAAGTLLLGYITFLSVQTANRAVSANEDLAKQNDELVKINRQLLEADRTPGLFVVPKIHAPKDSQGGVFYLWITNLGKYPILIDYVVLTGGKGKAMRLPIGQVVMPGTDVWYPKRDQGAPIHPNTAQGFYDYQKWGMWIVLTYGIGQMETYTLHFRGTIEKTIGIIDPEQTAGTLIAGDEVRKSFPSDNFA